MAFVDYYKILGVDKNIPQKDVRAAYRKRAKQFHPDLHPNDPKAKAKFQALNENRHESIAWAKSQRTGFIDATTKAVAGRLQQHIDEKGAKNVSEEIIAALGLKTG